MNLIGLDLGKTQDYSAMSVFTRRDFPAAPLPELPPKPERHGPDRPAPDRDWDDPFNHRQREAAERKRLRELSPYFAGEAAFDADIPEPPPTPTERRYLCRMLRKWPLGTSYVTLVEDVRKLCGHPMLQSQEDGTIRPPALIVDATGLGVPVIDMIVRAKVPAQLIAITITGGGKVTSDPDHRWWFHVPKIELVNRLMTLLQQGRIDFPPKLRDPVTGEDMQAAMMKELNDYRLRITKARNVSFDAEEGSHDDVLMSASYAFFWGERAGRTAKIW